MIEVNDGVLACSGTLTVEDAEVLQAQLAQLTQLDGGPGWHADLAGCEHVHAACLQVLMAAGVRVIAWPAGSALAAWLGAALAAA
jgi:anti-anti-sigma regulatory factor